ncbi:Cysteine desulfurase =_ SufS [hydrothermal vent metagenome]|uniref:cysteine desulfurase n=1 Tax=hydrothermal vent metagenome TaxID=652676 RepID=A0A3B0VRT8_9ZZZZ
MRRKDFPCLDVKVHNKPLVYFDNAATAQRPQVVIDAINDYYTKTNANVHRGVHSLSGKATDLFENARISIATLLNAPSAKNLIFTRGCTEGINLVAQTFVRSRITRGDEIIVSEMEHHSNIVPWQLLCEQTGAILKVLPFDDNAELLIEQLDDLITDKTKFMSVVHASNSLGTINPVKQIVAIAHARGVPVLVDGAQAMPHIKVDVQGLNCDFYTVSGHKMYGPTGIGMLYGKMQHLEAMPPYHGGGEMISHVSFEKTIYNAVPAKFEAGTPNIAGAIGLGAAAQYIMQTGIENIHKADTELLTYATKQLLKVTGLRIIGTAKNKVSVIAFTLQGVHPHDLGTILDHYGVAIRTGHHCTMPAIKHFNVAATARVSFAFYNTKAEIDYFIASLKKAREMFV